MSLPPLDGLARLLFDQSLDALFLFDPGSKQILEANPAAERLSGLPAADLRQFTFGQLIRMERPDGLGQMTPQPNLLGSGPRSCLLRTYRPGGWLPVRITIRLLPGTGKPVGLLTTTAVRDPSPVAEATAPAAGPIAWLAGGRLPPPDPVEADLAALWKAFQPMPAPVAVTRGPDHCLAFANPAFLDLCGRPPAALLGRPIHDALANFDGPWFRDHLAAVTASGRPAVGRELLVVREKPGDQREAFFHFHLQPLPAPAGTVAPILIYGVEVTEQVRGRQRVEDLFAQLEAERARLEAVLKQMPAGLVIAEAPSGRLLLANDCMDRIFHGPFPLATSIADYARYCAHFPDGRPVRVEDWPLTRSIRHGEVVPEEVLALTRADGTRGLFSFSSGPIRDQNGRVVQAVVSIRDITARKLAEQEVQDSRARLLRQQKALAHLTRRETIHAGGPGLAFRLLTRVVAQTLGVAGVSVWQFSADRSTLRCLERFRVDVFAHDRAAEWRAADHPEFFRALEHSEMVSVGTGRLAAEYLAPRGLSALLAVPVHLFGRPTGLLVLEQAGPPREWASDERTFALAAANLVALGVEQAERRRIEEAIQASETRYRDLLDNLEQSVFLKDAQCRYVAVNRRFCEGLGMAPAAVVGKTAPAVYPPAVAAQCEAEDRLVLTEGRQVEGDQTRPVAGVERTVRMVKTPQRDRDGRIIGVLGIFWDVTDQRALESRVQQTHKLEAIGQLAGGVAHDFNNLLTVILGTVGVVREELAADDPSRGLLDILEQAGRRAAELTGNLLGFARRTTLQLVPTDLVGLMTETVRLLRRAIDPRVVIDVDGTPDLWTVSSDPGQMRQVLMNLCLNARDAMPEGGTLTLRADNVVLRPDSTPAEGRSGGAFVRLRVQDTGCGIPEAIRRKIFEPFFTTKEKGKGTGLGLAMVYGIVEQHRGWIECHSEVGRGTRFDLYLPRADAEVPAAEPEPPMPDAAAGVPPAVGSEGTVLLVDDEAMIRHLARTVLERGGYAVVEAEDGQAALDLFQAGHERIDLVILDLTMPRLSGRDTARLLREIDPGVRLLLSSGYSADQVSVADEEAGYEFLHKPYRPAELLARVRNTLEQVRQA